MTLAWPRVDGTSVLAGKFGCSLNSLTNLLFLLAWLCAFESGWTTIVADGLWKSVATASAVYLGFSDFVWSILSRLVVERLLVCYLRSIGFCFERILPSSPVFFRYIYQY